MRVGMWDSSSISTLFSGLNNGRSTNLSSSFLGNVDLSTYNSIKSGSYFKLLKSYYSEGLDSKASSLVSPSVSTAADSSKKLESIQSQAGELVSSAKELYKGAGNDDTDAVYKKVVSFIDDYNSLVSNAADAETSNISKTTESLESLTRANAKSLARIGISVDSSTGKLSVDEETFKKSDASKINALFKGNGSYAYGVASKASMIEHYAKTEAQKSNTYSSNGGYTYNHNSGSVYNSYI